jgi:hypothetical protein
MIHGNIPDANTGSGPRFYTAENYGKYSNAQLLSSGQLQIILLLRNWRQTSL